MQKQTESNLYELIYNEIAEQVKIMAEHRTSIDEVLHGQIQKNIEALVLALKSI